MTEKQIMLALLAALERAEGHFGGEIETEMLDLQMKIEKRLGDFPVCFGDFQDEQQQAVLELAVDPVIFGS